GERTVDRDRKEQLDLGRRLGAARCHERGGERRAAQTLPPSHGHVRKLLYFRPEAMKLLTKRRWNRAKPISSGAMQSRVAAALTRQGWAPSGPRVKVASPTVSGRRSGELMTISGHKNSFQWVVTEMMEKLITAGRASGRYTKRMRCHQRAPSTSAASSS